jgi:hypothetical protein
MQGLARRYLAATVSIVMVSLAASAPAQQLIAQGPFTLGSGSAGFMLGEAGRPSSSLLPQPGLTKADAPRMESVPDSRPTAYFDGRENGGVVGFSYRLQPNPQPADRRTAPEAYSGRPER